MKFLGLRPVLWTNQIEETISFYTNLLKFICGEKNDEWGWAALQKDEIEIMIAKPNEHMPFNKPQFTGSFYILTNEVDDLWNDLKDKTAICYSIETFEWGMREFAVYDNNGYLLQFGQEKTTQLTHWLNNLFKTY